MLGRLARWLRLLGADTIFDASVDGPSMLRRARAEGRVLLTRDKRLRTASDVLYLETGDFRDQLRVVIDRFPFDPRSGALTRCSRCNSLLTQVSRESVVRRVPPFVYASIDRFAECPGCGHLYWNATHPRRIFDELSNARIAPAGGHKSAIVS
jgi:uncharacterized protein with PIN domain